ncbi:trypsin-like peptidase domain-containing protein [Candidatus Giovannonibacteria bacterium]|nr:trypsin-like peptidase domain-containing protein [Candidatus Giovannonibacteria bacterium]
MGYQEQIIKVIENSLSAVVSIAASKDVKAVQEEMKKMGINPAQFYDKLISEEKDGKITVSTGSGFIVDPAGIILTNKHVIQDKDSIYKVIIGKDSFDVEIVGKDPLADIAILKLSSPPPGLSSIPLGVSKSIRLGEAVIAIGNALGEFQNTVSTGIVSGLSRFLSAVTDSEGHQERLRGLIQTDAAINPGNSGGPLLNLKGEVIGINAAIVFGAQNIGFAIPIDQAKKDLIELKEKGHITAPFLGVRYLVLNKAIQKHFNIPMDRGALIVREGLPGDHAVLPGSSADLAGLKERDIILTANGKEINEKETLEDRLAECAVGDTMELGVQRGSKNFSVKVLLEDRAKFA